MNQFKVMSATLGILGAILAPSLRADENDKTTHITINQPLQVQGTLLAPGRYVFKLASPDYDHHAVQIYNADETRLETTVLAHSAYRLEPSGASRFIIADPQEGRPATLQFWFYPGDNIGLEFVTPKVASGNAQKHDGKAKPQHAGQAADDGTSTRD
jgi:hypothetical protein